jgi:two-component system chemotaxis response regulator CheB
MSVDGVTISTQPPPRVVALVGSSGGLEVLLSVLPRLPTDLPAAIVVLQHQSPSKPSHLARILERHSALPVHVASDGEILQTGTVAVLPQGEHALVTPDLSLRLIPAGPTPPCRPSGDLLLATLALAAGSRSVAVIHSGSGQDGATGATAVHQFGGTVIVADPATCAYREMSQAAIERDDIVDRVVPVDDLPAVLAALATPLSCAPNMRALRP